MHLSMFRRFRFGRFNPYTLGVVAVFVACAASSPSADAGEENRAAARSNPQVEPFARLAVGSGFSVEVRQGKPARVELDVSPEVRDHVVVEQDGDKVTLGLESNTNKRWRNVELKAVVTVPHLRELQTSGGSAVEVAFALTGDVALDASGGSRLTVRLDAREVEAGGSGGSRLDLRGKATKFTFEGSGATRLAGESLRTERAVLRLSGAAQADLGAKSLDASMSGGSRASVRNTERIEAAHLSGGASLRYPKGAKVEKQSVSGGARLIAI